MFVATILVYNEQEFIEANLLQHGKIFDRIIIIDGCDKRNNPKYISRSGLSTDKTKKIVEELKKKNSKIEFYELPFSTKEEKANFYTKLLKDGDVFIRIDADEFYTFDDLRQIKESMEAQPEMEGMVYPFVSFWKKLSQIATGSFFDVKHGKCFRYREGACFKIDHVRICDKTGRIYLSDPNTHINTNDIMCYHLGFMRSDMKRYKINLMHYIFRNERASRPHYIACREAYLSDKIPPDMKLKRFEGFYPEIFYSMYKEQLFSVENNQKGEVNGNQTNGN